jgi:hypothetical protein
MSETTQFWLIATPLTLIVAAALAAVSFHFF